MIDGDRGCSKWSSYRKADFEEKNFTLLFSLRDFHLNRSSISNLFEESKFSVFSSNDSVSCCCCFGCSSIDSSKMMTEDNDPSQSENTTINNNIEKLESRDAIKCVHHNHHYLAPALIGLINNKDFSDAELSVACDEGMIIFICC